MTRPTWLDALVGTELRDALEVEVHFASEAPLTTGDLALETDRGWFQLLTAGPEPLLRAMRTPSDVTLIGDWSDRSGVVLRPTHAVDVRFRIARIDYVQRGDRTSSTDTIGAWLLDAGPAVRLAVLFDAEDPQVGPPDLLWKHLALKARDEKKLTLFGR